ncbi:hypothetical protein [Microbispora sp. NPDC046933]|uniref:hypothetical protein n=1 Tax=Microbispora sp. NPDC046933 TaxID=3155618 RepID=UPI0033E7A784
MSGWSEAGTQPDEDEHQRFNRYLQQLEDVCREDEAELVRVILRDPDEVMAQSAVARHLDRRSRQLLTDPGFGDWFHAMATEVGEHEFLVRRLHDWMLLRSIAVNAHLAGGCPCRFRLVSAHGCADPDVTGCSAAARQRWKDTTCSHRRRPPARRATPIANSS